MQAQTFDNPTLRADARRNHQRLVSAARSVLIEDGVDASLEEIARRAEVGIATLYRHFPSRELLYMAVMHEGWTELHDFSQSLMTMDPPDEALRLWLDRYAETQMQYRGVAAWLLSTIGFDKSKWPEVCTHLQLDGASLIERGQAAGLIKPEVTWKDVAQISHGIARVVESADTPHERAKELFAIVLDGIRVRPVAGHDAPIGELGISR